MLLLWKCNKCHHEWEGCEIDWLCDWCDDGIGGIIGKVLGTEILIKIPESTKQKEINSGRHENQGNKG